MQLKSSNDFIPKQLRDLPLYKKVSEIIDDIRNENFTNVQDVLSKYKDFSVISDDAIKEVIKEFGYQYIIDVLQLSSQDERTLLSYISLIHFLKGHLKGVELVLNFLNASYTLVPWWQQIPIGVEHTFKLTIILSQTSISVDVIRKLKLFMTQYVYPKMDLDVVFELNSQLKTGMIGVYDSEYLGEVVYFGSGFGFNFGQNFGN